MFPSELINYFQIERSAFEYTINQLNTYFEEAESASCKTYCQGCCACLTAYLMFICVESHYEKVNVINVTMINVNLGFTYYDTNTNSEILVLENNSKVY